MAAAPPPPLAVGFAAILAALFSAAGPLSAYGDCPFCTDGFAGPTGQGPNVRWSALDSVAACPAGDSLVFNHPAAHPHPSRLRIGVEYFDDNCNPRVGIPPDSIWVAPFTTSGNLLVNDQSSQVFADDSTDGCGFARITIPSFSGCGTLLVYLYVAGVLQGSKTVVVRTTDMNADGRATSDDIGSGATCDLNYDGTINAADGVLVLDHAQHWHRHALHGTLVRRTNLKEFGAANGNNATGDGGIFWSPNGRRITYSSRDTCPAPPCSSPRNPCRVKWVFSDPLLGDQVFKLTFNGAPGDSEDYDPSWSPQGGYVYYDRRDRVIRRKGVPGLNSDTSDVTIVGDTESKTQPQISPDGDSLAYCQVVGGLNQVFVARATGGSTRQLTNSTDARWSDPHWSPDGAYLVATREDLATNQHTLCVPPRITQVGTQSVADTTVLVSINAKQGLQTNVQILATDVEGDPISCSAAFLQEGMTFSPSTCTLTWTPSAPVGTKYHVVFRVATSTWQQGSGGADGIIAEFTITNPLLGPGAAMSPAVEEGGAEGDGPNPTGSAFAVRTPFARGTIAELEIFDVSGRRVDLVRGVAGSRLLWNEVSRSGAPVPNGVYLYKLTVGEYGRTGRIVVLR